MDDAGLEAFIDVLNSVLCGPANVLTPHLMKPVITRDSLINSETEEKQWINWGWRAL